MFRSSRKLWATTLGLSLAACASSWSAVVRAEIPINDPELSDGWALTLGGRVDAYLSWISGETVNTQKVGNLVPDPFTGLLTENRYRLIGPQVGIEGNPTPAAAERDPVNDTKLNAMRIRGGFASTQLIFNLYKQLYPDLKLGVRVGFWAGIEDGLVGGYRPKNQPRPVDLREQYFTLSGSWGLFWGGRTIGLYNRGGMRMNWWLMHQHGIGHPCNVEDSGTATCGHTGVGSMFPNRNAQLGYATPDVHGLTLSVAMLDPSHIDEQWNRAPYPRLESELTYKNDFGDKNAAGYGDEINVWANGLWQVVGRVQEQAPVPPLDPTNLPPGTQFPGGNPGIAADATRSVWGVGGGAWGRYFGAGLGGTVWYGRGLGTATPLGNTAIDGIGTVRAHYGYLMIANYRFWDFELAAGYGAAHAVETAWDKDPNNLDKISVIKQVRGISGKLAYHLHQAFVLSIDGMNIRNTWWRGEHQVANVISAGALAQW